ncbi:hypothetical protein [Pseudooceanicola sp. 200-1SW]|uniref:hypothetical protein n=1 Tax=Pseudooceanicola sp. 200-1SW TaxID=3425949 RepID=UPI003D7F8176
MTDLSQKTFDRAEEIADALSTARGLHGALLHLLEAALPDRRPDLDEPILAVIEASRSYCGLASRLANDVARSAKDMSA